MLKYVLLLVLASLAHSKDTGQKLEDQLFTALDRGLTHTLAYHYLWPFSQLVRAAAALEADEGLELLQIQSDDKKYEINLSVKRFQPDELKIKVKDQYIIVEGKHKEMYAQKPILTNHFVQRFALPAGSKPEEVTAVLNEKGVLSIAAPKHKLPPPPPERDVPIEVRLPITSTENIEEVTEKVDEEQADVEDKKDNMTKKEIKEEDKEPVKTSESPLWQHLMESTTHVGKIRKKELKSTTKVGKENEVTKDGDGNDLDYIIDTETEE